MAEQAGARRSFATLVGSGLAAGAAAAIAGNQAWVALSDTPASGGPVASGLQGQLDLLADASAPPVTALALVLLATWGVVLVTRGGFRRAITALGLLAAIGTLGFAVLVWGVAADSVRISLDQPDLELHHTFWSYVGVLAGLVAVAASAKAVAAVRDWPEMGRRYDAPSTTSAPTTGAESGATAGSDPGQPAPGEERTNLELWRWIDEGHDPTDHPGSQES